MDLERGWKEKYELGSVLSEYNPLLMRPVINRCYPTIIWPRVEKFRRPVPTCTVAIVTMNAHWTILHLSTRTLLLFWIFWSLFRCALLSCSWTCILNSCDLIPSTCFWGRGELVLVQWWISRNNLKWRVISLNLIHACMIKSTHFSIITSLFSCKIEVIIISISSHTLITLPHQ